MTLNMKSLLQRRRVARHDTLLLIIGVLVIALLAVEIASLWTSEKELNESVLADEKELNESVPADYRVMCVGYENAKLEPTGRCSSLILQEMHPTPNSSIVKEGYSQCWLLKSSIVDEGFVLGSYLNCSFFGDLKIIIVESL